MEKSKVQIEKEALAYLTKVSKHLYVTNTGHMYKIILFESEGKHYYAIIHFTKDNILINTREALSDRQFSYYGNNSLSVLKDIVFPPVNKIQSMPYFKKMKDLIEEIKGEIKTDSQSNAKLVEKFKSRLPDLELVK